MNLQRIELAERTKGWFHPEEGIVLHQHAIQSPGVILEIGSYCGKSTIWLGDAAEQIGQSLISVDWHRGNPEMRPGNDCHDPDVWDAEADATDTLPHLRRTMEAAGLARTVSLICGTSEQVSSWWATMLGFVFIDADHGTAAMDDYDMWNEWIWPGGFLAFHDADGPIQSIMQAVQCAKDDGWKEVAYVQSLRVLQR